MQEEGVSKSTKANSGNLTVHAAKHTDSASCAAGSRCSLFACSAKSAAAFQWMPLMQLDLTNLPSAAGFSDLCEYDRSIYCCGRNRVIAMILFAAVHDDLSLGRSISMVAIGSQAEHSYLHHTAHPCQPHSPFQNLSLCYGPGARSSL